MRLTDEQEQKAGAPVIGPAAQDLSPAESERLEVVADAIGTLIAELLLGKRKKDVEDEGELDDEEEEEEEAEDGEEEDDFEDEDEDDEEEDEEEFEEEFEDDELDDDDDDIFYDDDDDE